MEVITPSATTEDQAACDWPGDGLEWESEPPRPFDTSDKAAVLAALEQLRREHGQAIRAAGWTRETLWCGLEPESATSWQTVPGLLHRLLCGDCIKTITRDHIELTSGVAWTSAGTWLAGPALESWKLNRGNQ